MSDGGRQPFIMRFSSVLDRTARSVDARVDVDVKQDAVEGSAAGSSDDTRWTRVPQETTDDDL
jgi:hypothetical protein